MLVTSRRALPGLTGAAHVRLDVLSPDEALALDWADPDVHGLGGAVVPAGCAVVLGDNRPTSWDSRHYGFVPRERMIGVVVRHVSRA